MWTWIRARLREDSTRSAIGQLGLLLAVVAVALGVDLGALLTQAEAYLARVVAVLGAVGAIAVQLQRIVTPDRPPAQVEIAAKLIDLAKEARSPEAIAAQLEAAVRDPRVIGAVAGEVAQVLLKPSAPR